MSIVTIPKASDEANEALSIRLEQELAQLESQLPEVQKSFDAAMKVTGAARKKHQDLVEARAMPQAIEDARVECRQAAYVQDGTLKDHDRKCNTLKSELELLSAPLRTETDIRWLRETEELLNARKIEVVKTRRTLDGGRYQDIRTNQAAIHEATEMLTVARGQWAGLRHVSIPEVKTFIASLESELRKLDLSRTKLERELPAHIVKDMSEREPELPADSGTLGPTGKLHIHKKSGTKDIFRI